MSEEGKIGKGSELGVTPGFEVGADWVKVKPRVSWVQAVGNFLRQF